MPLLSSTQTRTANNVPLYVPLDGEGNVPGDLRVAGSVISNSGSFQSGQITFPAGNVLVTTADGSSLAGTLALNSVTNGTGLITNVPFTAAAIRDPTYLMTPSPAVPVAASLSSSPSGTFVIGSVRVIWGLSNSGGSGVTTVQFTPNFSGAPALYATGTFNGGLNTYVSVGNVGVATGQLDSKADNGTPSSQPLYWFAIGPA